MTKDVNEHDDYIGNVSGVYRMGNIGGIGTHSGGLEHGNICTVCSNYRNVHYSRNGGLRNDN